MEHLEKYLMINEKTLVVKELKRYYKSEEGIYPLTEKVEVRKNKTMLRDEKQLKIESHRSHIDIQMPLNREELYYIYDEKDVETISLYDDKSDVIYYVNKTNKRNAIYVKPGYFLLLNPGEIHQPLISTCGETDIEKIVIKIKI